MIVWALAWLCLLLEASESSAGRWISGVMEKEQ